MIKITKEVKKKIRTVDMDKYANTDTGETLASEHKPENGKTMTQIVTKDNTGKYEISSSEYAVIDSNVLRYLMSVLNSNDLGRLMMMTPLTKTDLNVVYNNTIPHTPESLKEYLGISSRSKFYDFIKRLMDAEVLYILYGKRNGIKRKMFLLNPFVSRRRKNVDVLVIEIFQDFLKIADKTGLQENTNFNNE
jgi:hypothetical protein